MNAAEYITVRPRRNSDLPALAVVLARVHHRDRYPVEGVAHPVSWLTPPNTIASWTSTANNTPIGQIALVEADPQDEAVRLWSRQVGGDPSALVAIARLFVDPEYRARGAGRLLVTAALNHTNGLKRVAILDVMCKDLAAIRLYETLGGHCLGRVSHQYGESLTESARVFAFTSSCGWFR